MTEQLHPLMLSVFLAADGFYSPMFILLHNRLSAQTTHTILCLESWSLLGLVKDEDVMKVAVMKDVEGDVEEEFKDGWDSIKKK